MKQAFRELFNGNASGELAFVPLICSFAAKLRQLSVRDMLTDPNFLTNCIRDSFKLLKHDAVLNVLDTSLEAEALGCDIEWPADGEPPRVISHPLSTRDCSSGLEANFETRGRMPVVLEATNRLTTLMSKKVAVIGAVTGPLTIAGHLRGDSFFRELEQCARSADGVLEVAGSASRMTSSLYCERHVDAILLIEDVASPLNEQTIPWLLPIYESIVNVVHYYEKYFLVLVRGFNEGQLDAFCSAGIDGVILEDPAQVADLRSISSKHRVCVADCIPADAVARSPETARAILEASLESHKDCTGFFLSTGWEIPYETPVQNMQDLMNILRKNG
jgi:uroporphyrinogen decarboxylase